MRDIMVVLGCLNQCLDATGLRQLCCASEAMLSMTGRVTMRGMSRWTNKGGSDRTIQRFFYRPLHWLTLQWVLIRHHLLDDGDTILAAGDHGVVTKAGTKTYGLDRFFSSLSGKAVPGLCFLSLSLISVKRRTSYPALTEQVEKAPVAQKPPKKTATNSRGRPKGSKNRNRREVDCSPSLRCIQGHLARLLPQIGTQLQGGYFLFDGEFGHNDALQMVKQLGLHLVSKLRDNAALYFPYEGPYAGRGPRRKYGKKLDDRNLAAKHVQATSTEDDSQTDIYQMSVWHKTFADLRNIVVIVKTHLKTRKTAHVVLCSSDVTLSYALLIDYYRLRFQREFHFRDAKQYWGLEDFRSIKERSVHNRAHLAMFMVNVSQAFIRPMRARGPECSVNDLKAWFRGRKYVIETLKLLPEMPSAICIDQVVSQRAGLGRVNRTVNPV